MAIKIPGAAEVGIGRKTPGAIAEGTPRFVPKIRTGVGLEIAQAATQIGGMLLSAHQAKQEKAAKVVNDEAKNTSLKAMMGLKAGVITGSAEIEARTDLDIAGKDREQGLLLQKIEGDFRKVIPPAFQSALGVDLEGVAVKNKLDYEAARAVKVKDQRIADAETSLNEIETFSSEFPGNEKAAKDQARIVIDASPLSATDKVKRKQQIHSVIDGNTVENEIALGDPEVVLTDLQEKNESGAFKNYKGLSSKKRTGYTKQARDAVSVNRGLKIANDIWDKDGPTDKFDLIDIEDMAETARKRAGTKEAGDAAVTRVRERATLHNQARKARIDSNQATIWEAHDNGAKSAAIYKMQEFVELPAEERRAIQNTISTIAEAMSKEETLELKIAQMERFEELSNDSAKLREADLMAEFRAREITESGFNSLKKMQDEGSLPSEQSKQAFRLLKNARTDGLYNSDDAIDNARQYSAAVETLQDYILLNPDADPFVAVKAILEPVEKDLVEKLMDVFQPGQPGTEAFERRKAAEANILLGRPGDAVVSDKIPIVSPPQGAVLLDRRTTDGAPAYRLPDGRLWTP